MKSPQQIEYLVITSGQHQTKPIVQVHQHELSIRIFCKLSLFQLFTLDIVRYWNVILEIKAFDNWPRNNNICCNVIFVGCIVSSFYFCTHVLDVFFLLAATGHFIHLRVYLCYGFFFHRHNLPIKLSTLNMFRFVKQTLQFSTNN